MHCLFDLLLVADVDSFYFEDRPYVLELRIRAWKAAQTKFLALKVGSYDEVP